MEQDGHGVGLDIDNGRWFFEIRDRRQEIQHKTRHRCKWKAIRVTERNNQRKAPFSCRHATINNLQFDMQYELKKRMYRARSPKNELKYACTECVNLRIPARCYRYSNIKRNETRPYRHATQETEWPIEITGSERHFLSEIGQQ